jgi:hypothetical protein
MDIPMILSKRYEGAEWTLNGDNYSGLTWLSEDIAKPTVEELEADWAQVQFEVAYAKVEADRQIAYRDTADPVFFEFQRGDMTEADWLGAVQLVKDANPYPVLEDFLPVEPEPVIVPADSPLAGQPGFIVDDPEAV